MKALVVYYSLEGNTKMVADKIAAYTGADTLCLEPEKEYPSKGFRKFVWGGKSVVFGETPKLKPYKVDLDQYDTIVVGTPVWASSFAPPLKTFFQEHDLSSKKAAFFACSTGGDASKCMERLKAQTTARTVLAELSLKDPKTKPDQENEQKIKSFCDAFMK